MPATVQLDYDLDSGTLLRNIGSLQNVNLPPLPSRVVSVMEFSEDRYASSGIDFGAGGNDTLLGAGGHDSLRGEDGNDELRGGRGHGVLLGGSGDDQVLGNTGDDTLLGGGGNDTLSGEAGNDRLFGEAGDDFLSEGSGTDFAFGGDGQDRLFDAEGDDRLHGEAGDDILSGGLGQDTLVGGPGTDRFQFVKGEADGDTVIDFAPGETLWFLLYDPGVSATSSSQFGNTTLTIQFTGGTEAISLLGVSNLDPSSIVFES